MMTTPAWATQLMARVCHDADVSTPELTWRRSARNVTSSGRYFASANRIVVTAGKDRKDQRLVLLHELAHHLTAGHHHGDLFWAAAWRLYGQFGLTRYALKREAGYRKAATDVAVSLGLRGAKAAAKSATTQRRKSTQPRNVCPMPANLAAIHGYRTPHTHYVGTVHRFTEADGTFTDYWTPAKKGRPSTL